MSWSFEAIGTAEKVAESLEANSEKISKDPTNQCRMEFDEAKPHLIALVKQNTTKHGNLVLLLKASGSASFTYGKDGAKGEKDHSSVSVSLEQRYGFVG